MNKPSNIKLVKLFPLSILLFILMANSGFCEERFLFVAPDGNDSFPGTKAMPFKTLDAARKSILSHNNRDQAVTVWLREGIYFQKSSLRFNKGDSGTAKNFILYKAWPGENVSISGGVEVSEWYAVTDPSVLHQLPPDARKYVLQTDLKKIHVHNYGSAGGQRLELFFQDRPMQLARWPNTGFSIISALLEPGTQNIRGRKGSKTGIFFYQDSKPDHWGTEKEIWLHGYWFWDWSAQRQRIEHVDTQKKTISLRQPYHRYGYRTGQWYYAYNLLSELDQPGEYYLDSETGFLYFWPPTPINEGKSIVSVAHTLFTLNNTSHIIFEGLIFENTQGDAVVINNGRDNHFVACTFRNIGGSAVIIKKGTNCGVRSSDLYQIGQGGITLSGGNWIELRPGGNYSANNHLFNFGRIKPTYSPAISLKGVGNRAVHNKIHDAPHQGIAFNGHNHLIELNEIYNVCKMSNDVGAIYAARYWLMRGTIIRNNYLHDIYGFRGRGAKGIYLDDMFSGSKVYGNIFYRVHHAVFIGGGRDNTVENNIFIDCPKALHVDARALGWAAPTINIKRKLKKRLYTLQETSSLWRQNHPELETLFDKNPEPPEGNIIRKNIFVGEEWHDISGQATKYITIEDNLIISDPKFLRALPGNFKLRKDSTAFTIDY